MAVRRLHWKASRVVDDASHYIIIILDLREEGHRSSQIKERRCHQWEWKDRIGANDSSTLDNWICQF